MSLQIDSDLGSVELLAGAVRALCSDKLDEETLNDVELSVVRSDQQRHQAWLQWRKGIAGRR
ncbi:hypothetical protein N8D56_16495 [Devosia sp. A8/3-2]|nr:hypothetical protein N8D56_16495 [Devosia sp. A8/3-2]